jgi:phosphomannomutase
VNNKFIFDVDGTLTPSRGIIDLEFKMFFNKFCLENEVYLVTGSDKAKTVEQISESTYNLCKRVYNCSGNDVYEGSTNIRTTDWTLPALARTFLISCEYESKFTIRTGNHIEERPGMVNFSVVGRNATTEERAKYVAYDTYEDERTTIAKAFNIMFPELEARPGGETGIDIAPRGSDKSQILVDFSRQDSIVFFGDRMDIDGNDYPLKLANYNGINHHVEGWQHTWEKLREYSTNRT